MKCFTVMGGILLAVSAGFAAEKATDTARKPSGLDPLKKLAGEWVAADKDGRPTDEVVSSIRVTAAGSAVHETLFPGTPKEMITMYYMEGDDLVLVHYCALGNQPKMKAEKNGKPNELVFKCVGGSNVDPQADNHMGHAVLTFENDNRFKAEWTRCDKGKSCEVHAFTLVRKKK